MKSKLLTLAGVLALLAVLGHFYAKPLLAQVRAALVQNVDDPGRIPYQASVLGTTGANCSIIGCTFAFAPVPAGHRLVVQHVSMFIQPNANSVPAGVSLTAKTASSAFLVNVVFHATVQAADNDIRFDQPVMAYFDAGETPLASIQASFNTAAPNATQLAFLSGYMLDCTAGPCAAIVRH